MYEINQAKIDAHLEDFFTNAIAFEESCQRFEAKSTKVKAKLKRALKDLEN